MERTNSPLQFKHADAAPNMEQESPGKSQAPPPFQLQAGPPSDDLPEPPKGAGKGNLPEELRAGMENLSGIDLGDVNVHYNSDKPAAVEAHAYAQGTDIHLGPGQEKHLGHEAWHVVQQKQGRVTANTEVNGKAVNDQAGLEMEADQMGEKALQTQAVQRKVNPTKAGIANPVVQGKWMVGSSMEQVVLGKDDISQTPVDALLGALLQTGFVEEFQEIQSFLQIWQGDENYGQIKSQISNFLLKTLAADQTFEMDFLATSLMGFFEEESVTTDEDGETEEEKNDAPGEAYHAGGGNVEEEVFPTDITPSEIELNDEGLLNAFQKAAYKYGFHANLNSLNAWIFSNISSEAEYPQQEDSMGMEYEVEYEDTGLENPFQLARKPGAKSGPKTYQSSGLGTFKKVMYKTDSKGNIDFEAPKSYSAWANPLKANSAVELSRGSSKKHYGIMKSGTKVLIPGASRSQHFSIANRIKKIGGSGSPDGWTWHHMSERYEMELVDRNVHAKHGHNGGVYIW